MLTFKMARELKNRGIKVNSLQINGARMSKETMQKFKPPWRVIARIQNVFFPRPVFMAQNYVDICTAENFKKTTGKQINHKQEIMQPGPENPTFRHVLGTHYYPLYASDPDMQEKIWALCQRITDPYLEAA